MDSWSYSIANLRDHPQRVNEIADWHHREWLRGYKASQRRLDCSERDLAHDVRERAHNLRSHFCAAPVPSTFIALGDISGLQYAIGSVSIVYYQFSKHRKPSEWLTNLYVQEGWRGRGIGQALMDHLLAYAGSNHIGQVRLYTRDHESYYRKRNWEFCHRGLVQGSSVSVLSKIIALPDATLSHPI